MVAIVITTDLKKASVLEKISASQLKYRVVDSPYKSHGDHRCGAERREWSVVPFTEGPSASGPRVHASTHQTLHLMTSLPGLDLDIWRQVGSDYLSLCQWQGSACRDPGPPATVDS